MLMEPVAVFVSRHALALRIFQIVTATVRVQMLMVVKPPVPLALSRNYLLAIHIYNKASPVEKFRMIMFYNYILQSIKNKALYVGYTVDLRKRLKEHNQGLNKATKPYRPWELIYYEACLDMEDAKRREHYLKTVQGQRLSKRRLKEYFYKNK